MELYSLLTMLPLVLVLLFVIYAVVRNIGRAWLDHQVKLTLLERLENRPELLRSFDELQDLVDRHHSDPADEPQDYVLTGVMLAVIGITFVIIYSLMGGGAWAVGAYFGGVACVALGFLLALIGLFVRFLTRTPLRGRRTFREWLRSRSPFRSR